MPNDQNPSAHQTLDLPCEIAAVTEARIALLAALEDQGVDDRMASDAATVFSELLINAMLHGNPGEEATVQGSWVIDPVEEGHQVVLTVHDAGGFGTPRLEPADEHAPAGRGLRIVDAMSESWSVDTEDGTTVTAQVRSRPADRSPR